MRTPLVAAVALCLASGCQRDRPFPVERLEIGDPGALRQAGWQGSRADLEAMVKGRLAGKGFALHDAHQGQAPPERALRLSLEVPMARGEPARVAVQLQVRRRSGRAPFSYQVEAVGEDASAQGALELAIDGALRWARVQLQAVERPDNVLLKDLTSPDETVRLCAVRVLTDRRHPAVVPVLLEQLRGGDAYEVRRAIGALVELKEARAVPPLIELGTGRDPSLVLEVLYALGAIGGEEAEAYLYTVALGHDQAAVREAAQQALDELSRSEQKPHRGLSSRKGGDGAARH